MVSEAESENLETMVGYVVEGLTTLAGVGAITKLKHLRWFGGTIGMNTISGFRITIGTIEFSTGVLSFLQNFIECDQNNAFCKSVKNFVTVLNLSTGLIHGTESIISWALKQRAAKIVSIAGGVTEAEITQNIKQLLGGSAEAGEAAKVIFYSSIIPLPIRAVESIVNKALSAIVSSSKKYLLQADYTRESLQNYARTCHALGLTEDEIIHRIVMANRIKKKISLSQLEVETLFSVKVIKDRGFPGGYQNLNKYKAFCFEFEDALWDALDEFDIEFSALFRNKVKMYTGGSSNSRVLATEVLDAKYSAIQRPSNVPGDTDIQIVFESEMIYEKFVDRINSKLKLQCDPESAMLRYDEFDELLLSNIYDRVKPHLLSTDPNFFTFAFINPTGKYNNKPRTLFKYE